MTNCAVDGMMSVGSVGYELRPTAGTLIVAPMGASCVTQHLALAWWPEPGPERVRCCLLVANRHI